MRRTFFAVLMILFFLLITGADSAQAQCYDAANGQPIPCPDDPPAPPGDGTYIQGLPDDYDGDGTLDNGDLCREQPGPSWNHGCPEDVDTNALLQPESAAEATESPFIPPPVNGQEGCLLTPSIPQNINIRAWPLSDAMIHGQIISGRLYLVSMIFHIAGLTFYGIDGGWIESSVANLSSDGGCAHIPQYTLHLTPDQWTQMHTSGNNFACVGEFSSEDGPTCTQEFFPVNPLDFGPVIPLVMLVSDHTGGAIPTTFIGGVHVATGDINNDGIDDTAFGELPGDFIPPTQGLPSEPVGPFGNLIFTGEHLALAEGGGCSAWRCGSNDISFALAFDPMAEHAPQFMMFNGAARDLSAFQVTVMDAEEGIFALKMTPYGPETGPRYLPGHVIFTGLSAYLAQDFSIDQPLEDISALVPFEEQAPTGAFSPLIANENAYLQWVAQQEPDEAPLVIAVQASTELANQLSNRQMAIDTTSQGALVLNADERIEVASGQWFAYRAEAIPASDELGPDSSNQPLLSVGTDACNCELMIGFTVPAQPPEQFLGFLQIGIQR
jgi:hypothetical protein